MANTTNNAPGATNQASLSTNTSTTQSQSAPSQQGINFYSLEENINKWTLELEEQEKLFINQATQVTVNFIEVLQSDALQLILIFRSTLGTTFCLKTERKSWN